MLWTLSPIFVPLSSYNVNWMMSIQDGLGARTVNSQLEVLRFESRHWQHLLHQRSFPGLGLLKNPAASAIYGSLYNQKCSPDGYREEFFVLCVIARCAVVSKSWGKRCNRRTPSHTQPLPQMNSQSTSLTENSSGSHPRTTLPPPTSTSSQTNLGWFSDGGLTGRPAFRTQTPRKSALQGLHTKVEQGCP